MLTEQGWWYAHSWSAIYYVYAKPCLPTEEDKKMPTADGQLDRSVCVCVSKEHITQLYYEATI